MVLLIGKINCNVVITNIVCFIYSVDSDIDIAIVSEDFVDIYDVMAILMCMTWEIDARIEPHPITKDDYDKIANPFIKEVIDTEIKVAKIKYLKQVL